MVADRLKIIFGVENLRLIKSLKAEIRPITILVGRNNVGKSSYLRALPLISQSLNPNKKSLISWHDDNFVDFGNFQTSVMRGSEEEGILFKFGLENFKFTSDILYFGRKAVREFKDLLLDITGKVIVSVLVKQQKGRDFRLESKIELLDHEVLLNIKSSIKNIFESVSLNGSELPEELKDFTFLFPDQHILSPILPVFETDEISNVLYDSEFGNIFVEGMRKILIQNVENDIEEMVINDEIFKILGKPRLNSEIITALEEEAELVEIRKLYKSLKKNKTKDCDKLNLFCGLFSALTAYNQVCQYFELYLEDLLYFKPARTVDKRRFRIFGAGDFDIFPDGSNLSVFFESLTKEELTEYSDWLKENFDFGISFKKQSGSTSIFIEQDGIESNLVDSGFGISELLPILTQIWWNSVTISFFPTIYSSLYDKSLKRTERQIEMRKLIAIEQPELHLHPGLQAKLMDILVETIQDEKLGDKTDTLDNIMKPTYLIETHSESMINRLGQLVRMGQVNHNDIQILIFSKKKVGDDIFADIKEVQFNDEGHLSEWPHGFFRFSSDVKYNWRSDKG